MIIVKKQIKETSNIQSIFTYQSWKALKEVKFKVARFIGKNGVSCVIYDVYIAGTKRVNIISSSSRNQLGIDLDAVISFSTAVDLGNKQPNWQLNLKDGSILYLGNLQ
jgi:hypothetical protein